MAKNTKRPPAAVSATITREEIRDVLMSDGYSADQRKSFLKEVLTALMASTEPDPSGERDRLISTVRSVVSEEQEKGGNKAAARDLKI